MKKFLVLGLAVLMVLGFSGTGWASAILFFGNGATGSCPTGLEPGCPQDPNSSLGTSELSIFLNGTSSTVLSNPLILIIGIPDYTGVAPSIASVDHYDDFSSGDAPTSVGFGTADLPNTAPNASHLDPGEEVYSETGFNHGANNSNSFTNWAGATNSVLGLDPLYFALYAYRLNENLGGRDLFNVTWAAGIPVGTFAVAYGCNGILGDCLDGECEDRAGNPYSTPFTEAGMATPEPTTMFLLGVGLIGLAGFRKKFKK